MTDILIQGGTVILPDRCEENSNVLITNDVIGAVGRGLDAKGARIIDARDRYIAPGLIDSHIHGAAGHMSEMATTDGLDEMSLAIARHGTVGFLPTVGTSHFEETLSVLSTIAGAADSVSGAKILGIHMEGPYLSLQRAGAQRQDAIREYRRDSGDIDAYIDASEGRVRTMSLAPEIPGGMELIEDLTAKNIIAGAVHTDATFDQIVEASARGLTLTCHTFNAMRPLHHREPGVIAAALLLDSLYAECIGDGFHLAMPILEMIYRLKGPDRMVLISDSVGALGLAEGEYEFFGVKCLVKGGKVMIGGTDVLAGSASPQMAGIRNLATKTSIPLAHVFRAASLTPARLLGLDKHLGSITVGKEASLLVLDGELHIEEVFVAGVSISAD
ncbi:MAG: N-acetylglucosamine-6-phosphate deacetylase [Deltaproteobacteria bacterium]|nr:N-acetylglucosamine-6-phosphate deacetylase [Candidatus Zymogenaceae bacterium]